MTVLNTSRLTFIGKSALKNKRVKYQIVVYFPSFRIGRTARAGKPGVAITLLEVKQLKAFKNMLSEAKKSTSLTYEKKINISSNDVNDYETALAQIKVAG